MEIQNKEIGYRIKLDAGENIKILVNDIQVYNETVSTGKEAKVSYKFQENIISG